MGFVSKTLISCFHRYRQTYLWLFCARRGSFMKKGGGESPIDTPVQTLNGEKMKTIEAIIVLGLLGNKK